MFDSSIFDVALGLIFIYLLLSLICSAVHEMLEAVLKKRAADLERGLRELLKDPNGTGLVKKIYEHQLIFGLFQGNYEPKDLKAKGAAFSRSNLPSYIPARNFALALMDVVLPATATVSSGAANATGGGAPPAPAGEAPKPLKPLRDAIAIIENAEVKRALLTLVDAAGQDVDQARQNIEGWFNSSMDRVSGWYKRRTQAVLLCLGFVVAVAINADTVTITRSLARDRALRNSLTAAAAEYAKKQPTDDSDAPAKRVKANEEEITNLGLPVGWDSQSASYPRTTVQWFMKACGWIITAAAISFGAPFWFDLLNKIMIIRSTVKPHEKSPEEGSRD